MNGSRRRGGAGGDGHARGVNVNGDVGRAGNAKQVHCRRKYKMREGTTCEESTKEENVNTALDRKIGNARRHDVRRKYMGWENE